jgi:hypothetical protein
MPTASGTLSFVLALSYRLTGDAMRIADSRIQIGRNGRAR